MPIAQGLVNTRHCGFEPYLTVNILSGQSPAKPATAAGSLAVGEYVQIFESCDRMSALIYSAASFNRIQGENSSDSQPCYLPPQQLE
ncbi:hypothetical protein QUA82_30465 [Microcoleus sp. F8-D3]